MKLVSINRYSDHIRSVVIESIKSQNITTLSESDIKKCFPNSSNKLISEYKKISDNYLLIQELFVKNSVDNLYKLFEKFDPNQRIGGGDFGGDAEAMEKVDPPKLKEKSDKQSAKFSGDKTLNLSGDQDKRMGGGDFGGDAEAMEKAKGSDKLDEKEKKGLISRLKEFYTKTKEYMNKHPGQKMIIILAALGVVMTVASAFPAIGLVIKAIFGMWNMYKGGRKLKDELSKSKDRSKWQIALGIIQLGAGIFSASSVGADVYSAIASQKSELVSAAAENGVDLAKQAPAAGEAVGEAGATAATSTDLFAQGEKLKGTLSKVAGALKDSRLAEQYLEDPDKYLGKFSAFLDKLGIPADTPVEKVFEGARATGGMTVTDYIQMKLEGIAKASKMAALAR